MAERKKPRTGKPRARKPKAADKRSAEERKADTELVLADLALDDDSEGPTSSEDRARRNLTIFRLSLRGVDIYDIADTYDLHPKTVQEIINQCKVEGQRLSDTNPLDVIQEWLMKNSAGISQLAAAASGRKTPVAAKINAINSRLAREDRALEVMQAVGLIPTDLGQVRQQLKGVQLATRMLDLLEGEGVLTEDLLHKIEAEFRDGGLVAATPEVVVEGTAAER